MRSGANGCTLLLLVAVTCTLVLCPFPAAAPRLTGGAVEAEDGLLPPAEVREPFRFSMSAAGGAGGAGGSTPFPLSVNSTTFNVTVSTNPPMLRVTTDGVGSASPQTYTWDNGSSHNLAVENNQTFGDTRYVFLSWSDGGAVDHQVLVTGDLDLVATFGAEYLVNISTTPYDLWLRLDDVVFGAPASFWLTAGSSHVVNFGGKNILSPGTQASGSLWSDGGTQSHTITVVGPMSLVAEFHIDHLLTIETAYGNATCGNYLCWYREGTNATFGLAGWPPEGRDTRQDFRGWVLQPGNVSASGSVLMDGPKNVTAIWVTQYNLTIDAGYGQATGAGWHDQGGVAAVSIGATEVTRGGATWRFAGWSGAVNSTSRQIEVPMDGPKAISANWKLVPTTILETPVGISLVIVLIGVATAGAALLRTPRAEYALAALGAPLFTRLQRKDVRNQYNRGRLMQFIEDHPGANYSEIRRRLALGNGGCAYHLGVLERNGDIRRVVEGATVRFYPAAYKFDAEALPPLAYVQRRILEVLVAVESAEFGEVSRALAERGHPVGDGNLSHHLKALSRKKELISTRREGRKTIYSLEGEQRKYVVKRLEQERGVDAVLERATFGALGAKATTGSSSPDDAAKVDLAATGDPDSGSERLAANRPDRAPE